ncbi:MAG: FAD-dependent oxidoreductase [Saprospiraceae bacterium]
MAPRKTMDKVDFLIVGGGLFGVYTALYLARKNFKVCLMEKEGNLFKKASTINQARLHEGYHYPRSIATALMAQEHKLRFNKEHEFLINQQYESYYAIDKFDSVTSPDQFEQFCHSIDIPALKIKTHSLYDFEKIEALYHTKEFAFDPHRLASYYTERIRTTDDLSLYLNSKIEEVEKLSSSWKVNFWSTDKNALQSIEAVTVINATYAGTNSINAAFGMKTLDLIYEISELAFIESDALKNTSLTVIDGPFTSYMPYGLSGLTTLSSVLYTHHKMSADSLPTFDCQAINLNCKPDYISDCNQCPAKPISHQRKMIQQLKSYLRKDIDIKYADSMYTIKTKLSSSEIDDGRPTEIYKMNDSPGYYCLFSGKINSIYEIEKILSADM